MKKFFTSLVIAALLVIGNTSAYAATESLRTSELLAQGEGTADGASADDATTDGSTTDNAATSDDAASNDGEKKEKEDVEISQTLKQKFIDGGPLFMGIVLFTLIMGLALCIERIIYLNMATTNNKKLLAEVEDALNSGGVEAAKDVCRNTKGPVASIFYQGLDRASEGVDKAEKAVIGYGSVQMGLLEKGLTWISLFIALAPMLGFMGTVIGMIQAFGDIKESNGIEIGEVAGGIEVALLTTVFGLIVAIILQIFYNYIVSKIDGLVNQMEDASISLVDLLVKHGNK